MRVLLGMVGVCLLVAAGCGGNGSLSYSKQCEDLWPKADACWREYCQLNGGNQLFCACLSNQESLDGATCSCSGLARDSFLDSCSAQEGKVSFDCPTDKKRLAALEAKWQCCQATSDCTGGATCVSNHCQ